MCNLSELVEARGVARGVAFGEAKVKTELAIELLRDGMSYEKVSEYTKVSVETLKEWVKEAEMPITIR